MTKFTVEISTDNAAFDGHPEYEIARILRGLSDQVELMGFDYDQILLRDHNGNRVGEAEYHD